jgi:hypothetical protein
LTKPVDRALDFLPAEQREVHVGEKAEHRSFKVTGTIVSIDGKKAVLNVNGRRMTVDVKDLVPLLGTRASRPHSTGTAAGRPRSQAAQERLRRAPVNGEFPFAMSGLHAAKSHRGAPSDCSTIRRVQIRIGSGVLH